MIKLKNILNENAPIVFPHPEDGSRVAAFSVNQNFTKDSKHLIIFMAKTSKDLDKIQGMGDTIKTAILEYANKQFREIQFVMDTDYEGAGYAIRIDLEPIIKKLNK